MNGGEEGGGRRALLNATAAQMGERSSGKGGFSQAASFYPDPRRIHGATAAQVEERSGGKGGFSQAASFYPDPRCIHGGLRAGTVNMDGMSGGCGLGAAANKEEGEHVRLEDFDEAAASFFKEARNDDIFPGRGAAAAEYGEAVPIAATGLNHAPPCFMRPVQSTKLNPHLPCFEPISIGSSSASDTNNADEFYGSSSAQYLAQSPPLPSNPPSYTTSSGDRNTIFCRHWARAGSCPQGADCRRFAAHDLCEMQRFRPMASIKYKTILCRHWRPEDPMSCLYGVNCQFAHGLQEVNRCYNRCY